MLKQIPAYLRFFLKIYLSTLIIFTFLRILLFVVVFFYWGNISGLSFGLVLHAFLNGLRFDLVVLGYIFIVPFILFGISDFLKIKSKTLYNIITVYIITLVSISFLITCADIPYFLQYFTRLNTAAFAWIDDGTYMFRMIFQEFSFLIYFFLFLFLSVLSVFYIIKQKRKWFDTFKVTVSYNRIFGVISFIVILSLLLLGIRGRISFKSPIRTGTAYFCENPFLNQLGLNPVFTLASGYLKDMSDVGKKVHLMDPEKAKRMAAEFFGISNKNSVDFPFLRFEKYNDDTCRPNVVIVIMEGMSSFNLGSYGGPENITPNLKQLISQSYYFSNIYSAGIHTYNGIYSTLFSYPALYKQQPLEILQPKPHDGIANILKQKNYSAIYFTNHDSQFDNVEGFLRANGFDKIVSEDDYPGDWHRNANGIPDHKMFEFAINVLNKESQKGKPFLSVFMTSSNHKPCYLPENIDFKPVSGNEDQQMIKYSDWSIGEFVKNAAKQDWFRNTIFVFVGDHGVNLGHTYDMPLSYHHTPLVIFSPLFTDAPKEFDCLGGQIDVAPTVLGLLNISYENNTMGVDMLKYKRPFIYFCADDKIGCLDKDYYLIIRDNGVQTLFFYKNLGTKNYMEVFPQKVDSMKNYTFSMMQSTQWLIDHNKLKSH